ncbi:hypothetical protein BLOT_013670 [Blomia tropicalis]|nr:hypothetical protein BLOT_013670 [Blomia tropicalis]
MIVVQSTTTVLDESTMIVVQSTTRPNDYTVNSESTMKEVVQSTTTVNSESTMKEVVQSTTRFLTNRR